MSFTTNVLTAKDAIDRHLQWRATLQSAILAKAPLTREQVAEIKHPNLCAIGRWMESSATKPIRTSFQYKNLLRRHNFFHVVMENIADLLAQHRWDEAAFATGLNSAFQQAAREITQAILAVDEMLPAPPEPVATAPSTEPVVNQPA